jgi:outer membrane protein TolC
VVKSWLCQTQPEETMSRRPALTARQFVVGVTFLSVFFLMCNSTFAQDKSGSADKIKELKEKRLVLLVKIYENTFRSWPQGKITVAQVHQAKTDLLAARLDLAEKKEDRIKICEEAVQDAEAWENRVVDRFNKGEIDGPNGIDVDRSRAYVLEIRIALEKAKAAK